MLSRKLNCPSCGKQDFTAPSSYNLLVPTQLGNLSSFLRPETAQGIFINFPNILSTMNKKLPFGVGQIGKSFRNEISPRNYLFRMREFEQMELEYFCDPQHAKSFFQMWVDLCADFLKKYGIQSSNVRLKEYPQSELAHYAKACTDIEYRFPFGWSELWGIAYRGDYDLVRHHQHNPTTLATILSSSTPLSMGMAQPPNSSASYSLDTAIPVNFDTLPLIVTLQQQQQLLHDLQFRLRQQENDRSRGPDVPPPG